MSSATPDFATVLHIPIFPLNTVLFPGGLLPLRVFETRYVDMVRECMQKGIPFGVNLIRSGTEVAHDKTPAVPEPTGTLAEIADFDMTEPGILQIKVRGTQRFTILTSQADPSGLLRAEVELLELETASPINLQHLPCVQLLKRITDQFPKHNEPTVPDENGQTAQNPFWEPYQFDDASWVGNRLSEILPIPNKAKQKLMELLDADARLAVILDYLVQHQIVSR